MPEVEETEAVETAQTTAAEPDRAALESTVASKMADVFKDAEGDDDAEVLETPAPTKTPETSAGATAEKEVQKPATETPPAAAKTDAETAAAATPASPLVPAAFRRSLKAYQWTDEEIDAAAKADPDNFVRTAAKLHESRNAQTREMSELGRRLKAQQQTEAKQQEALPTKFEPLDIAALKKTYGDNEPFIKQLEGVNKVVEFANTVMPWMQASQQRQQQAELETLGRQIDGYFGHADMAPYNDVYGKTGTALSDKQLASRQQVLDTADLLVSGARQLGKTLSLEEALTLAHDSVSGPVREVKARQAIVKTVQARQQSISLRPGGRHARRADGTFDRKELQQTVKSGLAKAFGS